MILLYASFFAIAAGAFALLWYFAPGVQLWIKVLIAVGLFLILSIAATAWINWAAHQMPKDSEIIVPLQKGK